jgi:hypothetical protein
MGYGTQPHDWRLGELESMETLSLVPRVVVPGKLPVIQSIVANHHRCQAGMPH